MKNKLNNAVSIFLALIMVLSPVSVFCENNAAADTTVGDNEQGETVGLYEMNVLNSLGIVIFSEGMLNQSVTNEEFAGAAGLIGGVVSDYYQDGALDLLINLGYLPSSCAYPNRTINYSQAVKGMVSVLGYDKAAEKLGGYPKGYLMEASQLKITKNLRGIGSEDELTYGMLCVMMYNSLSVHRMIGTISGSHMSMYKSDENVASEIFKIYETRGRVTANSVTSLDGTWDYNPGRIQIDGVEFLNDNSAYDDFFGYNVKYYYKNDDADIAELFYMELDEDKNEIIETDKNDGTFIENKKRFYYTKNGRQKSVSISDGYCLVYNKKVTNKDFQSYQGKINGYVKMADTDLDGKYDFIEINSYDTIYVSRISEYENRIFDEYNPLKSASFDENMQDTKFIIRDTKGNDIPFSSIKKGNVVSVIASEDKTVAYAVVSTDFVTAVVDSVSYENNGNTPRLYAGDDEYYVCENLAVNMENIKLGEQYKLMLDFAGYAAGYEKVDDVFETGLLINVYAEQKALKQVAQIKVFCDDGSIKELDLAKKVTVDGVLYKKNVDACKALYDENGENYKSKLIRYIVRDDKVINIDTAFYSESDESENSLQTVGRESSKLLSRDAQCFAENYSTGFVYDAATTVFMTYIIDDPKNTNEYRIIKNSDLANAVTYPNVTAYSISAKKPDVKYVVIAMTKAFATQMQTDKYMTIMFETVKGSKDANGEDKYCICAWDLCKNIKVEKLVDDISLLDGINKGDILNIRFTFGGEIGSIFKAYDAKSNTVCFDDVCGIDGKNNETGPSYGTTPRWLYGRAYSAGSSYVYLLPESKSNMIENADFKDCKVVAVKRRQPGVYVYDTTKSKKSDFITQVSIDSISDYLNCNSAADRILVSSYPAEYSAIVIFK